MPWGLIIGGVIAAGAQVYSAKTASDASTTAANDQANAAKTAQTFNQQVYNTQQQNLAPYRAIGLQGLTGLSNMAATPSTLSPSGNGWVGLKNPNVGPAGQPPVPNYSSYVPQTPQPGQAIPRGSQTFPNVPATSVPGVGLPGGGRGPAPTGPQAGSPTLANPGAGIPLQTAVPRVGPTSSGAGVLMKGPDGTTALIDPAKVQQALQQGATIVSGQ